MDENGWDVLGKERYIQWKKMVDPPVIPYAQVLESGRASIQPAVPPDVDFYAAPLNLESDNPMLSSIDPRNDGEELPHRTKSLAEEHADDEPEAGPSIRNTLAHPSPPRMPVEIDPELIGIDPSAAQASPSIRPIPPSRPASPVERSRPVSPVEAAPVAPDASEDAVEYVAVAGFVDISQSPYMPVNPTTYTRATSSPLTDATQSESGTSLPAKRPAAAKSQTNKAKKSRPAPKTLRAPASTKAKGKNRQVEVEDTPAAPATRRSGRGKKN